MIKISISVLLALSISILAFYAFHESFPPQQVSDIHDHHFFVDKINESSNKVLLLGGSGAGQLNSTMIHQSLSNEFENYSFYNLAYNADTPKLRHKSINETMMLKPELILYGLTYYELNGYVWETVDKNPQPLPKIELNPTKLLSDNDPFLEINPKQTTLNFIRDSFADSNLFPNKKDRFQLSNSPFTFFDEYQTIISNDENLKTVSSDFVETRVKQNPLIAKEQLYHLENIIETSKTNNVEFVIIILPQQKYFLELVPDRDNFLFYDSLNKLKNKFNITIYDMSNDYADLDIWQDHNHVALHPKSTIFSEDIYKIIIKELKQNAI